VKRNFPKTEFLDDTLTPARRFAAMYSADDKMAFDMARQAIKNLSKTLRGQETPSAPSLDIKGRDGRTLRALLEELQGEIDDFLEGRHAA
jgi:hypothetical protein